MSRQAEINLHTHGGLQLGLLDTLSTEQIEFRNYEGSFFIDNIVPSRDYIIYGFL